MHSLLFRSLLPPSLALALGASSLPSGIRAQVRKPAPKVEAAQAEEFRKRFEAYMRKDYLTKAPWVLDYAEARARARREKKLIFVYFTRSYAP